MRPARPARWISPRGKTGRMIRSAQLVMRPSSMRSGSESSTWNPSSALRNSSSQVSRWSPGGRPARSKSPKSSASCSFTSTARVVAYPFAYLGAGSRSARPVTSSPVVATIANSPPGWIVRGRFRGLSNRQPSGMSSSRRKRLVRAQRVSPSMIGGSSGVQKLASASAWRTTRSTRSMLRPSSASRSPASSAMRTRGVIACSCPRRLASTSRNHTSNEGGKHEVWRGMPDRVGPGRPRSVLRGRPRVSAPARPAPWRPQ